MHPTAVGRLVEEIAPRIVGAKILDVREPGEGSLLLELSGRGRRTLGLSALRALPLLFLAEAPVGSGPPEGRPAARLGRELDGAIIVSLRSVGDAVADLAFRKTLATGRIVDRVLTIDLGRRPRLSIEDASRRVASAGPAPVPEPRGGRGASVAWRRDSAGRIHVRVSASAPDGTGESRSFASVNEAAAFAFAEFWAPLDLERRRSALEKRIGAALKRKRRAIEKVRAEIEGAADAEELRRRGRLILTRRAEISRGAARVTLLDYDGVTPVEISLDPALAAPANAESFFRRARRAERRSEAAPKRLAELEEEERGLTTDAVAVGRATEDDLAALEEKYGARAARRRRTADGAVRARYRTYTVSGGWEVLVGKSNRDNDVLTHRIAKPSDLWFHVRQAPGSHVILRRRGGKAEPDRQAILEAAAIAAFHSKAGRSTKVAVCYTEKRHVRKPRGARPGLAVVSREKVVFVEPRLPGS